MGGWLGLKGGLKHRFLGRGCENCGYRDRARIDF